MGVPYIVILGRKPPRSAAPDLYSGVIMSPKHNLAASCLGVEGQVGHRAGSYPLRGRLPLGRWRKWVKPLLCTHRDQSSGLQHHIKSGSGCRDRYGPRDSLASQPNLGGPSPVGDPVTVHTVRSKRLRQLIRASGLPVRIQVYEPACARTHSL